MTQQSPVMATPAPPSASGRVTLRSYGAVSQSSRQDCVPSVHCSTDLITQPFLVAFLPPEMAISELCPRVGREGSSLCTRQDLYCGARHRSTYHTRLIFWLVISSSDSDRQGYNFPFRQALPMETSR